MKVPATVAIVFLLLVGGCARGDDAGSEGPAATVEQPKTGEYVYDWSGRALDPDDTSKVLNSVDGLALTQKVARDGRDLITEVRTESTESVTRIRTRWEKDRVLLVSSETSGSPPCTFEPPVVVFRIPLRTGESPKQSWESETCSGSTEVSVIGRGSAPDVGGRMWATWKVEVRTETTTAGATLFENETRWISPELGMEIRTERVAEGTANGQRFHRETSTALRDRP